MFKWLNSLYAAKLQISFNLDLLQIAETMVFRTFFNFLYQIGNLTSFEKLLIPQGFPFNDGHFGLLGFSGLIKNC